MFDLPPSIPRDSKAVYAYLGTIVKPTLHDLKLMVLLEAAGEGAQVLKNALRSANGLN